MRSATRFMCSLALGVILTASLSHTLARDASKDYPRCIKACDAARTTCDGQCDPDCLALFPDNPEQRRACVDACHTVCLEEQQDCKLRCKAIKDGECPPNP